LASFFFTNECPNSHHNHSGVDKYLFYSDKPSYTISCRVTMYILSFLAANKLYFGAAFAVIVAVVALYARLMKAREKKARVQELVDGVISVLIEQV
jgi:hypothetical protein